MSINPWHRRLGHCNGNVIRRIINKADSGVKFFYSLLDCGTCMIRKSFQMAHLKNSNHGWVTEPLQVVNTDLTRPLSPTALENKSYMAK
ncbi:unnamed protein product [Ascophyllum nodosum]